MLPPSTASHRARDRETGRIASRSQRDGSLLLDLDYAEDAAADADFNIVLTDAGDVVEIQATAEGAPFGRERVGEALALAARGMEPLFAAQRAAVA